MKDDERTCAQPSAEKAKLREKAARAEERKTDGGGMETQHGDYYTRIEELVEERLTEVRIANRQLQGEIESRKRAEEALDVVATQWRETLDAISDAVWLMDMDQTVIRCNRAASRLFEKDYGNIIGRKCFELIHGASGPVEGCPFLRMHKSRREETVHLPVGDRRLNVSVTPLKNRSGKATGAVHVARDVTKDLRAREEIRESRKMFVRVLESITDRFFATDRTGKLVHVNRRMERFIGKGLKELTGARIGDAFPGPFGEVLSERCREALKKGGPAMFDAPSVPGGRVEVRVYPSKAGLAVYLHDIPEKTGGGPAGGEDT
jgi:PAS domain S-box-containing protein